LILANSGLKDHQLNLEICQPMVAKGKKQHIFGNCNTEKGGIQQYIMNTYKVRLAL
jgi:hypothetical protein